MTPFHLAQLRHLYEQMVADGAPRLASMAKGLLGPAIADEERAQRVANCCPCSHCAGKCTPCCNHLDLK